MIPLSKWNPSALFGIVFLLLSLIAVVGNLATLTLITLWIGNKDLRFIGSALFGFVLAQSSLIGLWMALGRWPIHYRLLSGGFTSVLLLISLIVGLQALPKMPVGFAIMLLLAGTAITALVALLIAVAKRIGGYTIVLPRENEWTIPTRSNQYGVGYLLFIMVAVAITLVVAKASIPKNSDAWLTGREYFIMSVWFGWLIFATSVILWFACLTILRERIFLRNRPSRSFVSMLVCIAIGPIVFQWLASWILGMSGFTRFDLTMEYILMAYSMCGGLVTAFALVLFLVRATGYRLEKAPMLMSPAKRFTATTDSNRH